MGAGIEKNEGKNVDNKEMELSERVRDIISGITPEDDVLAQTEIFVKTVLNPDSGRYDMLYRYEHTLRVTAIGQRIAQREGLPEIPLMMACLLHDVGYPECRDFADLKRHPAISARIAGQYLERIRFEPDMSDSICRGVLYHDRVKELPESLTPFELSVRDADDIDRFDMMRLCVLGHGDIGERSAEEICEICRGRLQWNEDARDRVCGTETARELWFEKLDMHRTIYEGLLHQMEETGRMRQYFL